MKGEWPCVSFPYCDCAETLLHRHKYLRREILDPGYRPSNPKEVREALVELVIAVSCIRARCWDRRSRELAWEDLHQPWVQKVLRDLNWPPGPELVASGGQLVKPKREDEK
jgi:hypothetical protein